MSYCCRCTQRSDRSETSGTLCAVVVDHTSRNIFRGHRRCRERSSVDRVYQRREYCTRTPFDMHRSSFEVRLWRRRYGRCSWLLNRVPTPARSASCPSTVEYDVSVFVDFQDRLELAVRNNINRLRECRGEVNFDTQVAPLHEVETRSITGVRCQIKPEEGVYTLPKSERVRSLPSSCDTLPMEQNRFM